MTVEQKTHEEDFHDLVNAYVNPVRESRLKRFLDRAQSLSIIIAALAFFVSLSQVHSALLGFVSNSDLLPLSRNQYANPRASSYLDTSVGRTAVVTYSPGNVLDDNPSTAWSECAGGTPLDGGARASAQTCKNASDPSMEGAGEWITIRLVSPATLRGIRIRNGYQRSYNLYRSNPRVKHLDISSTSSSGQVKDVSIQLDDDFSEGYQYFNLNAGKALQDVIAVRLTIRSAYPSEKLAHSPQYQDNSLSDIQLIPYHLNGAVNTAGG